MEELKTQGKFQVDAETFAKLRSVFRTSCAPDETIVDAQEMMYQAFGRKVDPHTATGVAGIYE